MKTLLNPNQRGFKTNIRWLVAENNIVTGMVIGDSTITIKSFEDFETQYVNIDNTCKLNTSLLPVQFKPAPEAVVHLKTTSEQVEDNTTSTEEVSESNIHGSSLFIHLDSNGECLCEYESPNIESVIAILKRKTYSDGSIVHVVETDQPNTSSTLLESFYRVTAQHDGNVMYQMDFSDMGDATKKQIALQEFYTNTSMKKVFYYVQERIDL